MELEYKLVFFITETDSNVTINLENNFVLESVLQTDQHSIGSLGLCWRIFFVTFCSPITHFCNSALGMFQIMNNKAILTFREKIWFLLTL